MKFIDLFCGVGGFHLALESHGHDCVFASEIDEHAAHMYEANHGVKPAGDITRIPADQIPDHDILCAGFPCQSFSLAGNRQGFDDPRGQLFFEIIRIAQHKQPEIMILENTLNILTIDSSNVNREIYNRLVGIDYRVDHVVLCPSSFGIPQSRKRVFFVAIRKDSPLFFWHPQDKNIKGYLEDILLPHEDTWDLETTRKGFIINRDHPNDNVDRPYRVGGQPNKKGELGTSLFNRVYSPKGHAVCVVATDHNLYHINNIIRRLHVTELKRLMGFPGSFNLSSGQRGIRQLGNAVVPEVVRQVLEGIR